MLWALVTLSLVASVSTEPPGIAVTRFRLTQVDRELGGYTEDRLAQRLRARGFKVTTADDLETVLGLERQKALLGCGDDASCLAEISSALGVSHVVTGRLTRLGKRLELDVRVIRHQDAQVVASATRDTDDESQLGTLIAQCADALADQLEPRAAPGRFAWRLWVPVVGGAAALLGGVAVIVTTQLEYTARTTSGSGATVLRDGEIGKRFSELSMQRGIGFALAGVGVALIVVGAVWHALTPSSPVAVSVSAGPGGAMLSLRGGW